MEPPTGAGIYCISPITDSCPSAKIRYKSVSAMVQCYELSLSENVIATPPNGNQKIIVMTRLHITSTCTEVLYKYTDANNVEKKA